MKKRLAICINMVYNITDKKRRGLVLQAEIKVMTFDRGPDLGNASVGTNRRFLFCGGLPFGRSPLLCERK